jgi:shikimate 5-dehydrogenase
MSLAFDHTTLGQRVMFGSGKAAANVAAEVRRLGARSVMVIATRPELAARVAADIEQTEAFILPGQRQIRSVSGSFPSVDFGAPRAARKLLYVTARGA